MKKSFFNYLFFPISVFLVLPVWSAQYYLKNSSGNTDYKIWDEKDPETGLYKNWSVESATGQNSESLPGGSDIVKNINVAYDLNGGDWTVGTFGASAGWQGFSVRNGTLTVLNEYYGQYGDHRWSNVHLVVPETSMARTGASDANPTVWVLSNGSVFDILGTMNSFHARVRIDETSTLNFNPTSYLTDGGSSRYDEWKNKGTFNLPNGMKMDSGSLMCRIIQEGGELNLGGDIISNGHDFSFSWTAGALNVISDAVFDGVSTTIGNDSKESSVILNVSENVAFSMPLVDFKQRTSLTKKGLGKAFLSNVPDILVLNEGFFVTSVFQIPSVNFAGGSLILEASSTKGMPFIKEVLCTEGVKAQIFLDKIYLLNPGTYTLVDAGNTLSAGDYEITLDPTVDATWGVAEDGSVVLTVYGVNEDPNALTWNPENDSAIWDAATAAWTLGGQQVAFADGSAVVFNGQESNYSGTVVVDGVPRVRYLSVQSDRDYRFSGDEIDTMYVLKSGAGKLAIDRGGFSGRNFEISGGTLSIGSSEYAMAGDALKIAASGDVTLSSHKGKDVMLFDFRYLAGSSNWETRSDYDISLSVESIADFIEKASPSAPDGMSLSSKSVYVSGAFFVNSDEAGTWSFKGIYDDGIILNIDGKQLFKTTSYQDTKTANVVLAEGWHTFEIRAYDGAGAWGHANCLLARNPTLESYVPFHEGNFNMNWYGSEIDSNVPPSNIPVNLAIADGASVVFGSAGYNITDISIGENVSISIDPHTVPANNTFLVVKDAEVKAALKDMIQESLGDIGTVVDTEDGLAWEMEAVFNNVNITDLEDKDGWMIGIVPGTDEDITIAGEGVNPVMDGETRTFNSITVADGASLTVASTREIPALTLNAGTAFSVVKIALGAQEFSYSECIPCENDVLIGQIDPMDSIELLSGFSAITAGTYWGGKGESYTDVIAKSINNGKSLHVQFKRYDDGYVKCAIVEFWNEKGNIKAKLVEARYWQTTDSNNVTHDFINDDGSYNQSSGTKANTDTSAGYSVKKLKFSVPSRNVSIKVTAVGAFSTAVDGAVIVNVEEGCVLDLSEAEVSCGAKIVKHGDGAIVFGAENIPQAFKIEEGLLVLQPGVAYDLSSIEIGESAKVVVWQDDAVCVAYPVAGENGTVIYYARGTYFGVGGWNDLDNWAGGALPRIVDVVRLLNPGTKLTIEDANAVMPSKIVVGDGASLKVMADVSLPALQLAPTASLIIGDNEEKTSVSVTLNTVLESLVDDLVSPVKFPVVEVSTNATFAVNPSNKLKNTDLRIFGVFQPTVGKDFTFGWADSGEVTYFALYADGGKINVENVKKFACCEAEGTVVVTSPIIIRDSTIGGYWDSRTEIGTQNSINHPFEFRLDNTKLFTGVYSSIVGGAAKLVLVNKGTIVNDFNNSRNIYLRTAANGQIVLAEGGVIIFVPADGCVSIENNDSTVPGLVLAGGRFQPWRQVANAKSAMSVVKDSVWELYAATCIPYGTSVFSNHPFDGLVHVDMEKEATLKFKFIDKLKYFGAGDHNFVLADTPIVGEGNIAVENEREADDVFTLTVRNGKNTASGTITACERSKLLFADGANWAGTVIAGNVALTNLTDGAAAASVNFAKLDLAADFPVRVWRDENGALVSDTLNVGEYLDSGAKGGRLAIAVMFEGKFAPGETFVLGTISKGAELPRVGRGWTARRVEGETEDTVEVERNSGFTITIR